ncbi:MAG: hypothetical protein C4576_17130 [Desulfobacteraceae bacterium]|nr:MAG: hypothetical protein C4576_17130 [Desulfobacteraceae bacterium]
MRINAPFFHTCSICRFILLLICAFPFSAHGQDFKKGEEVGRAFTGVVLDFLTPEAIYREIAQGRTHPFIP